MLWLKIIAAIVILSLAQDVSGKSIKKHSSKKQAVPGQKSHYLILMGNPVQDGRQNKGLGMILSSEHGPTSEGERYNPSIENHFRSKANSYGFKSGPDLAATLQQTSRHEPRNGYSYTEALFTGAPLLNGKPSSESDDGESKDEHEGNINNSNNNVQAVLKEDKSIHRLKDKGSWQQEGNGDYGMHKGDDTPKEKQPEDSVQKQIEIHTEEGVEGVALDEGHKNNGKGSEALTSSQSAKQVGTSLESKPDHNLLGKRPENRPDYDPHQYLIAGPSLYESSSESDTGRLGKHLGEYTKNSPEQESQQPSAHEANNHHQRESEETSVDKGRHEPLVQDIHHGLAAENTHDNYEHNPEGSSHPTEEEEKNNKSLSDKMSAQTSHEGSHNEGLHSERLHNEGSNNEGSHNEGMHNDPSSAHENLVHKEVGLPIERQPEESAGNAVNTPLDDGVATDLHKEQVSHTTNANLQHQHLASSGMGTDRLSIEEASHQMPTSLSHEEFVHKPELSSLGTSSEEHRINDNSVPAFLQSHESASDAVNSQPNGKKLIYSDIGPVSGQVLYTTSKLPVQNQNRSTAFVASEPNDGILHGDSPGMKHFPHKIITSSSEKEYTQKFISGSSQVTTGVSIKQSTHKITPVSHPGFADNDLGSENSDEERNSRPSDQDNDKLPSQSSFRESNKGLLGSSNNEEPAKDHQEPSPVEESRLDSHAHGLPLEGPRLGSAAYSSEGSDALTIAQQTGSTQPSPEGALHEHNTADEESKLAHSSGVPSGEESIEAQQSSAARFRPDNMMHETQNGEPPKDEGSNTAPTNVLKLKQESADVGDHGPPSYRPHEFQVGKPEMTSKEPGTNSFHPPATKEENQSLKYNDTTDGRMSEGIRHPGRKEEDKNQEDKNQEIVYYMKMAKGKPLFNGHEPYLDQNPEKSHEQAEHSAETDIEQHPSIDDGKSGELSDRRYRWRWNPRPVSNPSPSPSSFPSPSPSPSPSSFPSPSPSPSPSPNPFGGGGGGAVGGSSVDSSGEQSDSDFEQEALNVHNNYRKTHNVPEMILDRDLSNQAKAYAQKIANMGQLQHSSDAERKNGRLKIGENLAYACSSNGAPLTGKSATEMWYNEVCKPGYNFINGGFSGGTGHFTQVVWKDSVALGIGQGKATQMGMPCIYVVGRYKIAGNMNGQYQEKVLRGNFNQQYCNSVKSSYGK